MQDKDVQARVITLIKISDQAEFWHSDYGDGKPQPVAALKDGTLTHAVGEMANCSVRTEGNWGFEGKHLYLKQTDQRLSKEACDHNDDALSQGIKPTIRAVSKAAYKTLIHHFECIETNLVFRYGNSGLTCSAKSTAGEEIEIRLKYHDPSGKPQVEKEQKRQKWVSAIKGLEKKIE